MSPQRTSSSRRSARLLEWRDWLCLAKQSLTKREWQFRIKVGWGGGGGLHEGPLPYIIFCTLVVGR